MSFINLSKPTRPQVVHGAERALLAFVLACSAYLKVTPDPVSKVALTGAVYAGVVAVYQLAVSSLTSL